GALLLRRGAGGMAGAARRALGVTVLGAALGRRRGKGRGAARAFRPARGARHGRHPGDRPRRSKGG
ncbi:hypothetical protein HMPREF0731_0117, partial [Pseudoroseomonas cervicalis ATCC 49957]